MAEKSIQLCEGAVATIREALHIGLASLGSIEESTDYAEKLKGFGKWQDDMRKLVPAHPTGAPNTVSTFAAALTYLEGPFK
jgi:hypothetical protein